MIEILKHLNFLVAVQNGRELPLLDIVGCKTVFAFHWLYINVLYFRKTSKLDDLETLLVYFVQRHLNAKTLL